MTNGETFVQKIMAKEVHISLQKISVKCIQYQVEL